MEEIFVPLFPHPFAFFLHPVDTRPDFSDSEDLGYLIGGKSIVNVHFVYLLYDLGFLRMECELIPTPVVYAHVSVWDSVSENNIALECFRDFPFGSPFSNHFAFHFAYRSEQRQNEFSRMRRQIDGFILGNEIHPVFLHELDKFQQIRGLAEKPVDLYYQEHFKFSFQQIGPQFRK